MTILLLGGFSTGNALAQDSVPRPDESFSLGVFGGYASNQYRGDFTFQGEGLPDSPCGSFREGSGGGVLFGGMLEFPLWEDLRLTFAPEYRDRSGTMSFPCVDPASTRLPDGSIAEALTEHVVDITHSSILGRLLINARPFQQFPLYFNAGPVLSLDLPVRYSIREEIRAPVAAEFTTGGQVREYAAGDFSTSLGITLAFGGGIKYYLPAGERLMLVPELSYLLALEEKYDNRAFRVNALGLSLGMMYTFVEEEVPDVQPEKIVKPEEKPMPALAASLNLFAIESDGSKGPELTVYTDEQVTTRLYPLLSYIFFSEGSGTLPERYKARTAEETSRFSESNLDGLETLGIYYHVLDIIGSRMQRYPDATITVTGTQPDAPESTTLARQRAETVRKYLASVWGIPGARVTIQTRAMPATPTNPDTPEGKDENRRVEISSATYEITAPVIMYDTVRVRETTQLQLAPAIQSGAGVKEWTVIVRGDDTVLRTIDGTGATPEQIVDPLGDETVHVSGTLPENIQVELMVRDSAHQVARARAAIPVRAVNRGRITRGSGYYSLILFDFGRSGLREDHLKIVEIVNERTEESASVIIKGYTDRLGDDEYNRKLSEERAAGVARYVRSNVADVVGVGELEPLYDNTLPEGRFYSRCVTVETQKAR